MRKIEIRTESGIVEPGWIKSSEDFWYYNVDGKQIRWTWGEGDVLEIKEDFDAGAVPLVILKAVANERRK